MQAETPRTLEFVPVTFTSDSSRKHKGEKSWTNVLGVLAGALLMFGVSPVRADTHGPESPDSRFHLRWPGYNVRESKPQRESWPGPQLDERRSSFQITLTATGEALYRSPAFTRFQAGFLTTCTATDATLGQLTFWFLLPPLEQ